jgi:tetratricopeptide (TPR) repeat protein
MAAEQHVLMALVRHACAHGFDSHAWRLAHAQSCSLMLRGRWHDDIRQAGLALSAAARTGDPLAAAHVERQLGRAHVFAGELEAGMYRLRRALECYHASGDLIGLAETHRALGTLHYLRDDFEQAEAHYRIQLGYARELGHRKSITVALTHRSGCLTKLGRYAQALPLAAESLAVAESIGDERYVYSAWDELGQVHRGLGNAEASLFCFRCGLELCAGTDNRLVGSSLLEARIAAAEGDLARARELCLEVWHAQKDDDPEMAKQAEQMLAELEI